MCVRCQGWQWGSVKHHKVGARETAADESRNDLDRHDIDSC